MDKKMMHETCKYYGTADCTFYAALKQGLDIPWGDKCYKWNGQGLTAKKPITLDLADYQ